MKSSVTVRFMLITVPMFIAGAAVSIATWYFVNGNTGALVDAQKVNELAIRSQLYVSEMSNAMKALMIDSQNEAERKKKEKADEAEEKSIAELKLAAHDADIQDLLAKMSEMDSKQLNPAEDTFLKMVKDGKILESQDYFTKVYTPLREQYNLLSASLAEKAHALSIKQTQTIQEEMRTSAIKIIIAIFLDVVGVGAIIFLMVTRLAKGLRELTQHLNQAGNQVANASTQLASASQDVSSSSSEAAASLEETVASVEELSSMVKLNADHAREASTLSQVSSKAAEEGEAEIKGLITSMTDISQSSKKIEEIINVIDDIAFQTNLLALNAAVEAARAGEQGKGFAVVAEAVRNLAQRSASAAKDISTLIKDSVVKIENGALTADRSGTVLKNIVNSVKKVSELNHEIASASAEQATGISQISKAMSSLDGATQKNAASSEEMAASSDQMSSQAKLLQSLVSKMTDLLEGGEETDSPSATESRPNPSPTREVHPTMAAKMPAPQKERAKLALVKNSHSQTEAEKVIPFGDEPTGKVGSIEGF